MARNYGNYGNDSDNNSGSDDSGSSSGGQDDKNLTLTPHAEIQGTMEKVFGNQNRFGQSLGISMTDVSLVDGCLYVDPDKGNHKVFSWKDVVGMTPAEGDFEADEANKYLVKNYGGTEKRYELVSAVHPDHDDPEPMGNVIMWYSGSSEYGPKSASKTLAKILTTHGREMMVERDEWYDGLSTQEQRMVDDDADGAPTWLGGWLNDTSGDNVLRSDLQDREFAFFEVKRASNQSDRHYHHPIVEDVVTETEVTVDNSVGDSGGATQGTVGDSGSGEKAATDGGAVPAAQTDDDVPEPITDFVSSVNQFDNFGTDRAETLLDDFIGDDSLPLTQDLVDDFGGREEVLAEAGY